MKRYKQNDQQTFTYPQFFSTKIILIIQKLQFLNNCINLTNANVVPVASTNT